MNRPRPRVRLLEPEEWPIEMQPAAKGPLGALNVMKALMHHPDLFRRWSVFANHFLFKSTLPDRAREILILRVAWRTDCEYEWSQHLKMSADTCKFDAKDFAAIIAGPESTHWSSAEKALLRAVDSLCTGPQITERAWSYLTDHWSTPQILDIIAMTGNYIMLAMALNALRVPPDPGYPTYDESTPPRNKPPIIFPTPSIPLGDARIAPVQFTELNAKGRELLAKARGPLPTVNVIDTVAHNPDLLRRWMPFFNHCLHKQSLSLRARELVILRTGWLAGSAYEWSQHVPIALERGVLPAEIDAIPEGPAHERWKTDDRVILETVDALMTNFTLDDADWQRAARRMLPTNIMDIIFTVGQYRLVAGLLSGINIQLDTYLRFPPTIR